MADAAEKDDWVTAPAAGKDDWITAPAAPTQHWAAPAGGEFGDLAAQSSAPAAPQGQIAADLNSVGQGLVSGAGAAIAGAGRIAQAGSGPSAQRVLAALDLVDQGKNRDAYQKLSDPERQQVGAYRGSRPEDKQAQRDALQQTIADYDKPNAVTRAGVAVEGAAQTLFPVAPENEGIQTGVGRMIGGAAPALAAGAVGGPVGILASLATIGSQAFDGAYQDAVSKGATHEDADDAAGKAALAQSALMVAPVGRLLQRVPMPMRDGLTATLVNLGQHGVEFGSANALGTFANNYVASQTYDPGRSLTQGTGDAAIEGTIAGLIIPAVGGMVRGARQPAATVDDVMKAPDVPSAIAAAGQVARAPDVASTYGAAPDFVPPATDPLKLPRILALLNEDNRVAAGRPSFMPPDAAQPSIPTSWGGLFTPKTVGGAPAETPASLPAGDAAIETPVPQSVGAAASRDMSMPGSIPPETPAQKATALQKMVNQSADDRLTPQGRDDAVYVQGVERPEAMRDFTTAADGEMSTALAHKTLYNTDSNYHDQFDAQVKKNNGVMVDKLNDLFGDANARDAAMEEAKELMPGPVGLFDGEKPVDAQPIADRINQILASPAGKRDAVGSQLNKILPKLYNADGSLETLPSQIKGIRDDITDKLYDKTPTAEGNAARTAKNQLRDVLSVVDETIGQGLPGTTYQDYLTNLSAALGRVSKLDYLQKFLTGSRKLTDLSGNLLFGKVQRLLEDIQAHHADQTGGAKELSSSEINQIEAVRNELAAKDLLDRRAAVRGSPTAQLTNATGVLGSGPLGSAVKGTAEVALHAGLAATTHGVGNAVLGGYRYIVKPALQAAKAQQEAAALAAMKERLLDTAPSSRNPDLAP